MEKDYTDGDSMYVIAFMVIADIVMLFAAAFVGFPSYSYYEYLRFITFFSSLAGVFTAYELPINKPIFYAFICTSFIFNPLFPIRLKRSVWINIDIITGLLLVYMVYCVFQDYLRCKREYDNLRRK